jgi:hypothetical protein
VYAWRTRNGDYDYSGNFLTIWVDRQKIYAEFTKVHPVTPKYVAEVIKFNNLLIKNDLI